MKANELRIGNLATVQGQIVEVSNGLFWQLLSSNNFDELEPIPLTHEILVKAGFTKHLSSDKVLHHFFKGENPITHDWMIDLKWIIGREYPFYKNGYHEIKYLHQLQNLFYFLTGNELDIAM